MSSFDSDDHVVAEGVGYDLGHPDDESVDEDVELELIEHQSWSIELKDNGTLENRQHNSHHSE